MKSLRPELVRAARGMARIAATTPSGERRASLAYLALYACGYTGRGTLTRFEKLRVPRTDAMFLHDLARQVNDQVLISDWTVAGWTDDRVLLERAGIRAFVDRRRVTQPRLAVGDPVSFEISALTPGAAPGFVIRRPHGDLPGDALSRFYLNIGPSHAAWALGPLARALQRHADVSIKVLAHPEGYLRRDAAVIYVPSADVGRLFRILEERIVGDRIALDAPVPLLARRLGPGIGFADEPSDLDDVRSSFGRWVGSLFVRAAEESSNAEVIAGSVVGSIEGCGRDSDHPYLRAGRTPADLGL